MVLDAASYIFAGLILIAIVGGVLVYFFQQFALIGAFWFTHATVDLKEQANSLTKLLLEGKAFNEIREMTTRCIYDPAYRHVAYPKVVHKLTVWKKDVRRYEENGVVRRAVVRELDRLIRHYELKTRQLTIEVKPRKRKGIIVHDKLPKITHAR